jgi:hypothetical protein
MKMKKLNMYQKIKIKIKKINFSIFKPYISQKSVAGVIQGKMTLLTDDRLAAMFDLNSAVKKLKDEAEALSLLSKVDAEATLMEAASKFRI